MAPSSVKRWTAALHATVHGVLALGMAEALLDHADPHAVRALVHGARVALGLGADLARILPVRPGDDLEQGRHVAHRARHRAGVVECHLDGEDAGVGHQPVRGLVPVDAAPAGGHADRAALVATERHVGLAGEHQHAAAGGRAAAGVAPLVRVIDHAGGSGGAAAVEAEVGVGGLADDGAAGIENPGHHCRVDVGHVAFEHRGAVHHRHAGEADIVLERDRACP